MTRRPLLVAILVAAVLLVASCSSDGGDDTTTTTAEVTTTTAPESPTTTAATPTTAPESSTTTAAASGLPTDPGPYAAAFVDAWATGDQATASTLGTEAAVSSIFAFEGGGTWSLVSCEGAAGSSFCTFTAGGDPTVVVQVGNEAVSQGQEHAVTGVTVSG